MDGLVNLLEQKGFVVSDKVALFRAFDLNNESSLGFQQYLHGIAAMDPATPHGQLAGELVLI